MTTRMAERAAKALIESKGMSLAEQAGTLARFFDLNLCCRIIDTVTQRTVCNDSNSLCFRFYNLLHILWHELSRV